MTYPKPSPIGPDVDLEADNVRLPDGSRLTSTKADELAERALGRPGRPSVSGGRQHTPSLTVRVTRPAREALEAIASSQGRRLADVSRDALDEYIQRNAG